MSGKVLTTTIEARKFYKQTFALRYAGMGYLQVHTLLINPEDMSVDEPSRSSVTQTLGGAYVTDFGAGLPEVNISGTTGYKARVSPDGYLTDGYQEFKNIRDNIYRAYIEANDPNLEMYWFDWENDEYYQIQPKPNGFRLMRNKSESLLYRYQFNFVCLQRLKNRKTIDTQSLIDPRNNVIWGNLGMSDEQAKEKYDRYNLSTNISTLGTFLAKLK